MLQTFDLTKRYGQLAAVDHLNLTVGDGELFGFLGPNGAGKTTTIRMLTGLVRPTSGSAEVAGYDVVTEPLKVKAVIGYLAEEPFMYDKLTGREFLRFMAGLYRVDPKQQDGQIERLLTLFDLEGKGNDLIESYSHGMRQKLGLCSLLVHNPKVLLLDEPTSGLDPKSARLVKEVLKGLCGRGATVFMSTHILEIAEHMCDRVGIINHGTLIAVGTLEELRDRARVRNSTLEDIFLELTGGPEYEELAAYLGEV